jgi:hypothetical protein
MCAVVNRHLWLPLLRCSPMDEGGRSRSKQVQRLPDKYWRSQDPSPHFRWHQEFSIQKPRQTTNVGRTNLL